MAIRLHFWGAAQTVTGSSHHIETAGRNVLLDCGMFQGHRAEAAEINQHLAFAPEQMGQVDAVVLSHAHIDHSGLLPLLHKQSYKGPVYASSATIDLCGPMLKDSAFLQESDAEWMTKRNCRRRSIGVTPTCEPIPPLYTQDDAAALMPQFKEISLHTPYMPGSSAKGDGFSVTHYNAGHMLGSTIVYIEASEKGATTRLLFSGDVGRKNLPIIKDPDPAPAADYLIMESTYGDRLHLPIGPVKQKLADLVNKVAARGGHIVMPAFAVGRTQQVVMLLHELIDEKKIQDIPIFVDSPLAVNVTDIFRKHIEEWDEDTLKFTKLEEDPFGWQRLRYVRTVDESKALNGMRMPFIVISASGMCEGGRVLHHLKNSIEDPRNLVLMTGYAAENTLGRKLQQNLPEVKIFGEAVTLRAEVDALDELSGHADQQELLAWMEPVVRGGLKKVFLVHGELEAQQVLKGKIEEEYKLPVEIPKRGDRFEVG
jgi:metallo-beta-lactamase family protein